MDRLKATTAIGVTISTGLYSLVFTLSHFDNYAGPEGTAIFALLPALVLLGGYVLEREQEKRPLVDQEEPSDA